MVVKTTTSKIDINYEVKKISYIDKSKKTEYNKKALLYMLKKTFQCIRFNFLDAIKTF